MIIDGIGWNEAIVKGMSKKDFVADPGANSLCWKIADEKERKKVLAFVHDTITGNKDPVVTDTSPARQD